MGWWIVIEIVRDLVGTERFVLYIRCMNRVIKFRAWDVKENVMLDWNTICQSAFNRGEQEYTLMYRVLSVLNLDKFIPMQYTNLVDCREKEIYDGDIVQVSGYFHPELMQLYWRNGGWHFKRFQCADDIDWNKVDTTLTTIIGNIYENPELLK